MPLDFKPQKSVEWYDPKQLANTGIKAVISSIFGNFNDKREIQAALYQSEVIQGHDYSDKNEIWIDYIADLGDGFDATYTMAKLLASDELMVSDQIVKRGDILIMGGDQVYPTASRDEYQNRLKGPYKKALPYQQNDEKPPHLFAIPGNHDWYDGLANFIKIFCQKRSIGNWRTKQTRSYFALKLPYNVWLFGIDVQLNSDVDFNQIQYFRKIIDSEVKPDSKIILCTAEPTWVYSTSGKSDANKNLEFFEKQIIGDSASSKLKQIITIAGDFHHYARYENESRGMKFTAGGGGAFMHPTQNLPKSIGNIHGGDLKLKKTYPESAESKGLIFQNFKFPITNYRMGILLGIIYGLIGWMLYLNKFSPSPDFLEVLTIPFYKPAILVLMVLIIVGLGTFADSKPYNPRFKSSFMYSIGGYKHGVLQALLVLASFYFVHRLSPICDCNELIYMLFIFLGCVLCGFIAGGFLFGLYLITANLFLGNHDNEAYSALKWTGYKNFLRLHLTSEQLTIYPIGVKKVAHWKTQGETFVTDRNAEFELIESPIQIKL